MAQARSARSRTVSHVRRWAGTGMARPRLTSQLLQSDGVPVMKDLIARIDRNIDETLLNLGNIVLRLSSPELTRSREERRALAQSVNQFSLCASHSSDPRVQLMAEELRQTLKPRLRLVASRI
jgi:hypothetical protein